MKLLPNRAPHHPFLLATLVLFITSFLVDPRNTVDIHLHDTMFVISHSSIFVFFASICGILWILYLITASILPSRALTILHVFVTLSTMTLFLILVSPSLANFDTHEGKYLDKSTWASFGYPNRQIIMITYSIIIFTLAQVLFLINILIGIFRRLK